MRIGIAGTGKLGICQALCLDSVGFDVYCYDINADLLSMINNKTLETNEHNVQEMLRKSNLTTVNTEEELLVKCDVIFVYIQTPSLSSGTYDHTHIDKFISKCISIKDQNKKIICISSTVMPEYTDSIIKKLSGTNYDVCYNPTFIAQGSIIENLMNQNMILIGGHSTDVMNRILSIHCKMIQNGAPIYKMTPLEAEICKISINCFITTKISFANMIGDVLISKGIEPSRVLNAVGADIRIGNKCLAYGYGFGGPCFPRDNRALYQYGKEQGFDLRLCTTTDKLNKDHLINQYNVIKSAGQNAVFTYITYKDNSDILEESQKLQLANMLADSGIPVVIKERQHIIDKLQELYGNKFNYSIIDSCI